MSFPNVLLTVLLSRRVANFNGENKGRVTMVLTV